MLESSKATCQKGATDCISIKNHGQKAEVTKKEVEKSDPAILTEILPGIDFTDLEYSVTMIDNKL